MSRRSAVFMAGAALLAMLPFFASAGVYRWVDEDGVTQFAQTPPPNVEAERVDTLAPSAVAPQRPAAPTPEVQAAEEEAEAERRKAAETARDRAAARELRRRNCETARFNIEQLQRANIRYRNAEGEVVRMDDEVRQQRLDEAQKQIQEFCDGRP